MEDIGKPPDHGRPPEHEAFIDRLALREAAEHVTAASDLVGSTEIDRAHEIVLPLLELAETNLLRQIQHLEAREERVC